MTNSQLQRDAIIDWLSSNCRENIRFISPDFGARALDDFRKKEYFEKPAQKKQRLKNAAKRRESKRNKETQLQPLRLKDRLPFKK